MLLLGKLSIGTRDKRDIGAFDEVLLLGINIGHMVTLNLYVLFICYRSVKRTTKQFVPMKTKLNTGVLMVMVVSVVYLSGLFVCFRFCFYLCPKASQVLGR